MYIVSSNDQNTDTGTGKLQVAYIYHDFGSRV